jgi:hypothetical protein
VGKNGNGEGNIRQRKDGRYEGRYCVDTPEGLRRRSIYGKTRKEVADKLAEKLANRVNEPTQPVQTSITVREFFTEYEEVKSRGFCSFPQEEGSPHRSMSATPSVVVESERYPSSSRMSR